MSIVLLGIIYLGLFLLKQPIFLSKNNCSFVRFSGGQFQPEEGGQFEMAKGGQFLLAGGVSLRGFSTYTSHPNPTDTTTLPKHLEQYEKDYNQKPFCITADAGYGSEENYRHLEQINIQGFVKYNYFDKQKSDNFNSKHPFAVETLHYNKDKDGYYCPISQQMNCIGTYKKKTSTGFEQTTKKYQAQNCQEYPLRSRCHKSKYNRVIDINHQLNYL